MNSALSLLCCFRPGNLSSFSKTRATKALFIVISALAFGLWTNGLAFAQANAPDTGQYATIQGSKVADNWPEADQYTTIVRIDEGRAENRRYDDLVEVTPGEHKVVVQFKHGQRRAGLETTVDFEAGKAYVAKAKEVGSSWLQLGKVDIVIEEVDSSKVVAEGVASVDYRMPVPATIN